MSRPGHTTGTADIPPYAEQMIRQASCVHQQPVVAPTLSRRFAQILSLILAIHFASVGAKCALVRTATCAGALPAGVAIFDTLFIGANGTFSIKGDLYLGETRVLGKGRLRLNGDSPQRIISQNSKVTNLDLVNPGRVTLSGELHVMQSLTIRKGTLEADRAQLHLSDSTQVKLLGGAILLVQPELLTGIPFAGSMLPRMAFAPEAILPSFGILSNLGYRRGSVRYKTNVGLAMSVNPDITSPPPEVGTVS